MPASCEDALLQIKAAGSSWVTGYNNAMTHHADAESHWNLGQDHEAIEDILLSLYDIRQMGNELAGWSPYDYQGPIWWYLTNCVTELTLIQMIEAYINADDDARSAHRLLLDAYQASMYDKPFDREYHALWIQRFRSWQ